MVVIGRYVLVGMICSAVVMGMIFGTVVMDDCLRLIPVAIHGGDGRPL